MVDNLIKRLSQALTRWRGLRRRRWLRGLVATVAALLIAVAGVGAAILPANVGSSPRVALGQEGPPQELPGDFHVLGPPPSDSVPLRSSTSTPVQDGFSSGSGADPNAFVPFDTISTIEGISYDVALAIPPDPHGAAGPGHLVSVVNSNIQFHTKAGALQNSQTLATFFGGVGIGTFIFDPKVIYDQFNDRFVVVALQQDDPTEQARILIAASDDSIPNGTWHRAEIDSAITINGEPSWADFPGLAVDEEAIYVTGNMFEFATRAFNETRVWIIRQAELYAGAAPVVTVHDVDQEIGFPSNFHFTFQPAHVIGAAPAGAGTLLVSSLFFAGDDFVSVVRIDDPLGIPAFSQQSVPVGNVTDFFPAPAPQLGTLNLIDAGDLRMLEAVWRSDALWATTIIVPSAGPDAFQDTAHWFQIDTSTLGTLTLTDQGDVGGNDIDPGAYTYYPSIAVNAAGDMAMGFALSSPNHFAGAYYTGRLAGDPPGTVRATQELAAGLGPYTRTFGGPDNRWGDYTGMSVDPSDDATFWVFNEYALVPGLPDILLEDGRWGTRWGSFTLVDAAATVHGSATVSESLQNATGVNRSEAVTANENATSDVALSRSDAASVADSAGLSFERGDVVALLDSLANAISASRSDALTVADAADVGLPCWTSAK